MAGDEWNMTHRTAIILIAFALPWLPVLGAPWWDKPDYPTTWIPMCKSLGLFQYAMTGPNQFADACPLTTYGMDADGDIDLYDWAEMQVRIEADAYGVQPLGTGNVTACVVVLPPDGCNLPPGWPSEEQQREWGERNYETTSPATDVVATSLE